MGYVITRLHVDAVKILSAIKRYEYALKKIADWAELWSLRTDDGWVLYSDPSGKECFPIWPHPAFAEDCAIDTWLGGRSERIDLQLWRDRWLPGLDQDQRLISVFPNVHDNGAVVDPLKFREDLERELAKFE